MSFLPKDQLIELATMARWADREVRSDLAGGYIRGEDDYTSNFTGALRRNIRAHSQTGLKAVSFLLQPGEERRMGVDAAIIITNDSQSKVAVFESKYPRFSQPGYRWDGEQTATGLSHFSDQLDRQQKFDPKIAVFEMFACEFPIGEQPDFLPPDSSSCVWLDDAKVYRGSRPDPNQIWTQADAEDLLTKHGQDISQVMLTFGQCRKGHPIRMMNPRGIIEQYRLGALQVLAVQGRSPRKQAKHDDSQ
jgi:hypothetical protein